MKHRSITQLHQDMWRCILRYPFYFLGIAAIIYFPIDYISEKVVMAGVDSFWSGMKASYRYYQIVDYVIGTFITAFHFEVMRRIAKREEVSFGSVLSATFKLFPKIFEMTIMISINMGLRLLLLIVPGILKGLRLAITIPVYIFDETSAKESLKQSEEYMKGHCGRFFWYVIAYLFIYILGLFGMGMLIPPRASPLVCALFDLPYNMLACLWTVGVCLFYADIKGDLELARPVGISDPQRAEHDPLGEDQSSKKSFVFVTLAAIALFVSGFIYSAQLPYFENAERVYFGEAEHELYYRQDVSPEAVESIEKICLENATFRSENYLWLLLLEKEGGQYKLNFVFPESYWNDPVTIQQLSLLQDAFAQQNMDAPIQVVLYDDETNVKVPVKVYQSRFQEKE